jgi:hypothetical protein
MGDSADRIANPALMAISIVPLSGGKARRAPSMERTLEGFKRNSGLHGFVVDVDLTPKLRVSVACAKRASMGLDDYELTSL